MPTSASASRSPSRYRASRWITPTRWRSSGAASRRRSRRRARRATPARAAVGQAAYDLNVQQYCAAGLNFGYYYDDSPIIAYDGAPHPPYSMGDFTPSTVPGCRTPHLWLADGRSLYDALGPEYTLLRFDPTVAVDGVLDAARKRDLPLRLLDIVADDAAAYDTRLVLSRPDQHIAWRGDTQPEDALALIDRVRGAS